MLILIVHRREEQKKTNKFEAKQLDYLDGLAQLKIFGGYGLK